MAINQQLIDEINKLARKKKASGLTKEELQQQKELREKYLKEFKKNMTSVLDNVDIVDKVILENNEENFNLIKEELQNIKGIVNIEIVEKKIEITYIVKNISEKEILENIKKLK